MAAPCTRTSLVAIAWTIACVRAASAQALWEPPSIGDGRQFPVIAVASDLIPALRIDNREIVLDRTPLAETAQRFKARIGDPEAEVTGDCLTALMSADPKASLPFVAQFLDFPSEPIQEGAALAAVVGRHVERAGAGQGEIERARGHGSPQEAKSVAGTVS